MEQEPPPPRRLPFISEETRQRLLEELRLDTLPTTARVLEGITGERQSDRVELVGGMTQDIFADLISVNRPLAEEINKFTANYGAIFGQARLEGMALVLRAYDIELEHDIIGRLANLYADDLMEVEKVVGVRTIGMTTLQKLLTSPRVPEQQVALNYMVKAASIYMLSPSEAIIGAGQMYALLTKWWPKLYPPQPSSQPESPPQPDLG